MTTTIYKAPTGQRYTRLGYILLDHWHDCEHSHFECAAWKGGPCAEFLTAAEQRENGAKGTLPETHPNP